MHYILDIFFLRRECPGIKALPELIEEIVGAVSKPVVYNGDVFYYEDIASLKATTKCTGGVMVGRGKANCSS